MHELTLENSSTSLLSRTVGDETFFCDVAGNKLPWGVSPLPMYRDLPTGEVFVRVAEVIPSGNASADVARREELEALKPVHYCGPDGFVRGWFIPAPDFSTPAVPEPAAA